VQGNHPANAQPQSGQEDSQDVEMSAVETTEQTEDLYNASSGLEGSGAMTPHPHGPSTPRAQGMTIDEVPKPQKKRMVITHDKYMTLQSLIVLHLSEVERDTGKGIDRDELIDWYLELQESAIQDVEELEYEKMLITKVLKKLVKVGAPILSAGVWPLTSLPQDNYLIQITGDVQNSLPTSMEESNGPEGNVRVYYMVHPSVDTESSSSMP